MTGFPSSPRIVKGGLVLLDPESGSIQRIVALQYNPDTLSRSLQVPQGSGDGDRSEALRLSGPPVETIRLEAEIDATDQLEDPDNHEGTVRHGIHPQLAALETLVYPTSSALHDNSALANRGALEIVPMQGPLALFVWSRQRAVPVRVTELSITEEAFDAALNPIRAKVSLGVRVLSVDDLGFSHKGGSLFMSYLKNKEALSGKAAGALLGTLGLEGIP